MFHQPCFPWLILSYLGESQEEAIQETSRRISCISVMLVGNHPLRFTTRMLKENVGIYPHIFQGVQITKQNRVPTFHTEHKECWHANKGENMLTPIYLPRVVSSRSLQSCRNVNTFRPEVISQRISRSRITIMASFKEEKQQSCDTFEK